MCVPKVTQVRVPFCPHTSSVNLRSDSASVIGQGAGVWGRWPRNLTQDVLGETIKLYKDFKKTPR